MHTRRIAALGTLCLLAALPLAGQSRRIRVDGRGYATRIVLEPESGSGAGAITWTCANGTLDLGLALEPGGSPITYVVWRFDDDAADTTFLVRGAVRRGERPRFTARAASARRLSVRVMGPDPTLKGVEHSYDLSRGSVLRRLPCADGVAARAGAPLRWPLPEGLVANPSLDALRSNGKPGERLGLELSEVTEPPQAVNGQELLRELSRRYPPRLRDAGVQGTVNVRFLVLEDGRIAPGSVSVQQSSHAELVAPVLDNLPILHFRPAKVGGRPVKVWAEQPVVFAMPM
jgi:TonB family protein